MIDCDSKGQRRWRLKVKIDCDANPDDDSILGHSNLKMTERYAKLAKQHIARTSNTAQEMWKLLPLV